jgi:hypothetical protein
MKIPNGERAIVDIGKLRDYCLSLDHPRGRHKARVFAAVLGLTADHAELLQDALKRAALEEEALTTDQDEYGQRYVVDFIMSGPSGEARIRAAWIVKSDEDFPRLTSCYVL